MNSRSAAVALLVLFSLGGVGAADANEIGFYIGGQYGQVTKDGDEKLFDDFAFDVYDFFFYTPVERRTSFDDQDSAFSILVGYRLTRHLAFEGGYTELGQLSYRATSSGAFRNDLGTLDVIFDSETSGFQLSVLGILPVTRNWELYGRAGALTATNRFSVNIRPRGEIFANPGGDETEDAFSESSTEWFVGAGASMRFLEIYDLRLDYQHIPDAGTEQTGGVGDINVLTLGILVTF
ncbi:MAG: outer membrane beta-barrel protein [Steroidobacter sp.]